MTDKWTVGWMHGPNKSDILSWVPHLKQWFEAHCGRKKN